MPAPTFPTYLDHIRTESRRFRDVMSGCDPAARVPSCPDWDAADLVWHLAEVQCSWAQVVRMRPTLREDITVGDPHRPESYEELLESFDDFSGALVHELEHADPADAAWTWSAEQTVGFTYRRQAHEALIHRVDAEQAAGVAVSPLDPALAADGVLEVLDVMYGGHPSWGAFSGLPHHVEVRITDADRSIWVQLGRFSGTDPDGERYDEDDISVVDDPGVPADAVVSGTAADLDLWLWKRGDDSGVHVTGDEEKYDVMRAILGQPLN